MTEKKRLSNVLFKYSQPPALYVMATGAAMSSIYHPPGSLTSAWGLYKAPSWLTPRRSRNLHDLAVQAL